MASDLLVQVLGGDTTPAEVTSWETRLQAASFRGVPFFVASDEHTFGRRLEVNEYPDREIPHTLDLGRRADRFRIVAFVVGDDYDLDRNKLVKALRAPGPGELVTQRYGTHRVLIVGGSVREEGNEGRSARILFEAVEAGLNREPSRATATKEAVKAAAASAQESSLTSFLLKAADAIGWAEEALVATTQAALAQFSEFGTTLVQKGTAAVALDAAKRVLESDVAAKQTLRAAYSFAEAGSGILDLYEGIAKLPDAAVDRLRILEEMRHADETEIGSPLGPDLARAPGVVDPLDVATEKQNRAALAALIRQAIVIARGLTIIDAEFRSAEEIARLREDFLTPIDAEIQTAGLNQDDDAYIGLRELRTAVLIDLTERGERLPDTADFTPPVTASSLLISQRLYGTGAREGEIVNRLQPTHPGFIAGGDSFRVPRE